MAGEELIWPPVATDQSTVHVGLTATNFPSIPPKKMVPSAPTAGVLATAAAPACHLTAPVAGSSA